MSSPLIELHFLPSLEYWCALMPYKNIILEKNENFLKQSFRNRCYILTAQGTERLTIPVTAKRGKVPITGVRIDYSIRWQVRFWRTLESAYANAPFFEHYKDELHQEIFSNQKFLYDLNHRLLSLCLHWLKWDKVLTESINFKKSPEQGLDDLRNMITAKKDFREREYYIASPYQQVFGKGFVPNLSILDLVFCEGPHSASLLARSRKGVNK